MLHMFSNGYSKQVIHFWVRFHHAPKLEQIRHRHKCSQPRSTVGRERERAVCVPPPESSLPERIPPPQSLCCHARTPPPQALLLPGATSTTQIPPPRAVLGCRHCLPSSGGPTYFPSHGATRPPGADVASSSRLSLSGLSSDSQEKSVGMRCGGGMEHSLEMDGLQ
jgi:hypothetical protein